MINYIYGVSDKTGNCPFYTHFFKKEEDAIIELEKQMDYARMEFGLENSYISGYNVIYEGKVIFSIEKFKLK